MKIGMLFPDYGSQYVGMGKELYDESRLVQEYFEEAYNCLSINFVKLCFASSDEELSALENAYVSIFLTSVSLALLIKQEGIAIDVVAGHGIGELSALCTVDGISLPDGLYFLQKYALFYSERLQTINARAAYIKGINSTTLKKICSSLSKNDLKLSVAVYSSEYEHVVTGNAELFSDLATMVAEHHGFMQEISVKGGLHSDLMNPVVETLEKYCTKIDFKTTTIPLVSCADGALVTKNELIKRRVMKQLHAPIMWNKVMQQCADWDVIIEIGPGKTLAPLIRALYPEKAHFIINTRADIEALKDVIASSQKSI